MSTDENERVVRRFIEEGINGRRLEVLDEVFAPEFVWHGGAFGEVRGLEDFKQAVGPFFVAFPDLVVSVENVTAADDRVAVHFSVQATHRGEFLGVAATDRRVRWDGHPLYRFDRGRIVEEWFFEDHVSLLQQLGGLPSATE
jgi:steroid delta-isomerase-like uncharacterized protein